MCAHLTEDFQITKTLHLTYALFFSLLCICSAATIINLFCSYTFPNSSGKSFGMCQRGWHPNVCLLSDPSFKSVPPGN